MQFVLLIYQGSTPIPNTADWEALSDAEKKQIYQAYQLLNKTLGVTSGLPLGLPSEATTVRAQHGHPEVAAGSFHPPSEAVAGYVVVEAPSLEAVIQIAKGIPAARLGGAVEIRPVATYW